MWAVSSAWDAFTDRVWSTVARQKGSEPPPEDADAIFAALRVGVLREGAARLATKMSELKQILVRYPKTKVGPDEAGRFVSILARIDASLTTAQSTRDVPN